MAAKYLVYAGCDNEGQVLQGQPYDGPLDSASVAAFALETLRGSPYHSSNTAWGLAELDWENVEAQAYDDDAECPFYEVPDLDGDCLNCDGPATCECEPDQYFVYVTRNIEGK